MYHNTKTTTYKLTDRDALGENAFNTLCTVHVLEYMQFYLDTHYCSDIQITHLFNK